MVNSHPRLPFLRKKQKLTGGINRKKCQESRHFLIPRLRGYGLASHHNLVLFLLPPRCTNSGNCSASATAVLLLLYSPVTNTSLDICAFAGTSGLSELRRG